MAQIAPLSGGRIHSARKGAQALNKIASIVPGSGIAVRETLGEKPGGAPVRFASNKAHANRPL